MAAEGEVDALVPERVWQEFARGLMEARPSRMFEVLRDCGALQKLMPEVQRLWGVPQRADYHPEVDTGVHIMMVIDAAAGLGATLPARFAALTHDLGKGTTPPDVLPKHTAHEARSVNLIGPLCERLRVPVDCREVALLVARYHTDIHRQAELRPDTLVKLLESCDALRRPERFEEMLLACEADFRGRLGWEQRPYPQRPALQAARAAAAGVDGGAIAKACSDPATIPQRIREARIEALKDLRSTQT
jgi:tRNA nucleotidyltransferase (CCA-adding enzyme)